MYLIFSKLRAQRYKLIINNQKKTKIPNLGTDIYFGTTMGNMELAKTDKFDVEPFQTYYIKYVPYLKYATDDERHYMDTTVGPIKIFTIPRRGIKVDFNVDGAYGQMGATIHYSCNYVGDSTVPLKSILPFEIETFVKFKAHGFDYRYSDQLESSFGCDSVCWEANKKTPSYQSIVKQYCDYELKTSEVELINYLVQCLELKLLINKIDTVNFSYDPNNIGGRKMLLYDKSQYYIPIKSTNSYVTASYQKATMGNKVFVNLFNNIESEVKKTGFHRATNDDWLDYEESLGIEREDPQSYFCIDEDIFNNVDENYEELMCLINDLFKGENTNIANEVTQYLAPVYWNEVGNEGMQLYWYNTNTIIELNGESFNVFRLFVKGQDGVLRCLLHKDGHVYLNSPQIVQD
mgnify:CR=1 FL=1